MKAKKILPVLLLIVIAAGLIWYFAIYQNGHNGDRIVTSGHIEMKEMEVSFRIPGHVVKFPVEEGDKVKAGQELARLKQDTLLARVRQAEAAVNEIKASRESLDITITLKERAVESGIEQAKAVAVAAEARLQTLNTGSREEEIRQAKANRDRAAAEMSNRLRDYQRLKALFDRKIISASQMEDSRTAYASAKAAYDAAEEQFKLVKIGPRTEAVDEGRANLSGANAALEAAKASRLEVQKLKKDRDVMAARLEQARQSLALAQNDLNDSTVTAPYNGFILVKDIEEGEFVQAGTPVLTMARLDEVWVKTYIPETLLGKVHLGQEARVVSDTFPDKEYPGRVTYISQEAEFTPKNVQTREERVKLVYRIKVSLDNPNQELKAGMPVDVYIR